MENIYDVFRMLVSRSRQTMADTEVDQAMAIINAADLARQATAEPQITASTEINGGGSGA